MGIFIANCGIDCPADRGVMRIRRGDEISEETFGSSLFQRLIDDRSVIPEAEFIRIESNRPGANSEVLAEYYGIPEAELAHIIETHRVSGFHYAGGWKISAWGLKQLHALVKSGEINAKNKEAELWHCSVKF